MSYAHPNSMRSHRHHVGALVAFFLGNDATFITGQTIHVDGGIGSFR